MTTTYSVNSETERGLLQAATTTYLGSMQKFKLVEERPSIAQVRLQLDGPVKPLSRFCHFALRPEQPDMNMKPTTSIILWRKENPT